MKTSTAELKDFVIHQAAEDAGLSPSERTYQEDLVADVLGQEAANSKTEKALLDLYRTEKLAA